MAFSHNPTQDLGHFVMPHLIDWWKTIRIEHDYNFQKIAEVRGELRKADKELGPCKKRDGFQATTTKRLFRHRRSTHEKLKPLESHIYTLKRHLASFEDTFNAAIQPYARSSCLALTTALHTKLPRELRDMIYTYLLDSNTVTFLSNQVRHQALHPNEPFTFALPLFLDPEFTARPVTSEIMHRVAKQYAVVMLHERSPLKLSELAKVPALGLEYPASEFFLNLRITVFPFTTAWGPGRSDWIPRVRKLLLAIPARDDCSVKIELRRSAKHREGAMKKCEQELGPVLEEIKGRGFKAVEFEGFRKMSMPVYDYCSRQDDINWL